MRKLSVDSTFQRNEHICFHLTENSSDHKKFLFFATYAISQNNTTRYTYLGQALEDFKESQHPNKTQKILAPIVQAAQESHFIDLLYSSRKIFQTLHWTIEEAFELLGELPLLERLGITVRIPQWWIDRKPLQPKLTIKLGEYPPQNFNFNYFLDFSLSLCIDNEELSELEIQQLLSAKAKFILFKGRWVEIDTKKLKEQLERWQDKIKNLDLVSFTEAIHLLLGYVLKGKNNYSVEQYGFQSTHFVAGQWLKKNLQGLQEPTITIEQEQALGALLKGELRSYQKIGVGWLYELHHKRLGGILADDMGLGKTVQILSLFTLIKNEGSLKALLILPVSLIANWKSEIKRFTPQLKYWIAHPSEKTFNTMHSDHFSNIKHFDIIITTYTYLQKLTWIKDFEWDVVVADEAQFIKNPCIKQTRVLKEIKSKFRLALTGTPIENNLSDLWSLFDFTLPGYLGTHKQFSSFLSNFSSKKSDKPPENEKRTILKSLIQPFILRRLKSDKKIIQNLPDKIEKKVFCPLTREQVSLYQKTVSGFQKDIEHTSGIERKGIILVYLMRLKQICNHPAQFLKIGHYKRDLSGKFQNLCELCLNFSVRQEKVLIFTQFKAIILALDHFLRRIFNQPGLILHGDTSLEDRAQTVSTFQKNDGPPYLILSLKTGGTGLNLTSATQIIHFDRWWNPAVENQATDRAYRIGQTQQVIVHKFICQGTLEEKIDSLLESKHALANEMLNSNGSEAITNFSNQELIDLVTLEKYF